jgi:hypothetical protein
MFLPGFVSSIPSAELSCHMKTAPGNASQDLDGPDGRSKLNRTKTIGVGLAELMQQLSRIEIETGGDDGNGG